MSAFQSIIFKDIEKYIHKLLVLTTVGGVKHNILSTSGIIYYINTKKDRNILSSSIYKKLNKNKFMSIIDTQKFKSNKNKDAFCDIAFSGIKVSDSDMNINKTKMIQFKNMVPFHRNNIYVFSVKVGKEMHVSLLTKDLEFAKFFKNNSQLL
jgi:hypothetical protein